MEYVSSEKGFLGLPLEDSVPYEEASVVVIPFGLEASVSFKGGTKYGPQAIIEASHEVELFDEEFWYEPYKRIGITTIKEPKLSKNIKKELDVLADKIEKVLANNKFPFVLGGEHSITAGAIRPFVDKYSNLIILHFDAHADLRDGYDGQFYSHAAALRRCLDYKSVSLISIGIRNISQEEVIFYENNKNRVKIFWAKDKEKWDLKKIAKLVKNKPIYLTFDLDGFDSSIMPATGTPEPGGFFWQDAINIIKIAAKSGNIVGADINELSPQKGLHACDFLAAKLAYKIMSYALLEVPNYK